MKKRTTIGQWLLICSVVLGSSQVWGQVEVLAPLTRVFTVAPGGVYDGEITLINPTSVPSAVRLLLQDYRTTADGEALFLAPGSLERSSASWLTLERDQVTLAPQERRGIGFRLRVPETDELTGTFWNLVIVEPLTPTSVATEDGLGVAIRGRYAVQIVSNVGDSGERQLSLANPTLTPDPTGGYRFSLDVANTGERLVVPQLRLELYDDRGALREQVPADAARIYPTSTVRQSFALTTTEPGRYEVLVIADAGADALYGARYSVTLE